MNNKKIKKSILNNPQKIDEDLYQIIPIFFENLYTLMKQYKKNKSQIEKIISTLNNQVNKYIEEEDLKKLDFISNLIKSFNNKIITNYTRRDMIIINESWFKIKELFNYINNSSLKIINKLFQANEQGLEYLIFEVKDLEKVKKYLELNYQDKKEITNHHLAVFEVIIELYSNTPKTEVEDLDYLYNIIKLFTTSTLEKKIKPNKEKYLNILRNSPNKDKIDKLLPLFEDLTPTTEKDLKDEYRIKSCFSPIIKNEITKLIDISKKYNFTNQEVITIDSPNTHAFDDALFLEKQKDGTYNLYIHITDIPSLIPYKSKTSKEAQFRTCNIHLKDKTIPMYPSSISHYKCSLVKGKVRNVITFIIKVDNNLSIIEDDTKIVKGTIKVKHKLDYNTATSIIMNPDNSNLSKMLFDLFEISMILRKNNNSKELYRIYENTIFKQEHHESTKADISPSTNIIHELMVLCNYLTAKYFQERDLPFIYRKIAVPSDKFLYNKLRTLIKNSNGNKFDPNYIVYLKQIYSKGVYTNKPEYHQGLDLSCYSHCTSPLYRYVDSYCQYLIHNFIFQQKTTPENLNIWDKRNKELINYLNKRQMQIAQFSTKYNNLLKKELIKK